MGASSSFFKPCCRLFCYTLCNGAKAVPALINKSCGAGLNLASYIPSVSVAAASYAFAANYHVYSAINKWVSPVGLIHATIDKLVQSGSYLGCEGIRTASYVPATAVASLAWSIDTSVSVVCNLASTVLFGVNFGVSSTVSFVAAPFSALFLCPVPIVSTLADDYIAPALQSDVIHNALIGLAAGHILHKTAWKCLTVFEDVTCLTFCCPVTKRSNSSFFRGQSIRQYTKCEQVGILLKNYGKMFLYGLAVAAIVDAGFFRNGPIKQEEMFLNDFEFFGKATSHLAFTAATSATALYLLSRDARQYCRSKPPRKRMDFD